MPTPRPLVLDTHVWIWLLAGDAQLSLPVRHAIAAAARTGDVVVAAITAWEVAMLAARGRIAFTGTALDVIRAGLAQPGLGLAPLSPEIAVEATMLPGEFHRDPADRMIVATARVLGGAVVTRDENILRYGAGGHVATLPA
ncbi:MAG: type II toxin-antitoxin system VapC family toxin [Magnetospirillum sp.]|nr:type II toxin-antitoxin system VapC family toxin [Magnetospirillum sp.]